MKIHEIVPLLENLDTLNIDYSLDVHKGLQAGRLWISGLSTKHEHYHTVISLLTRFYGKLEKKIDSGTQSWTARKDNQDLLMYRVAQCKVTSYRTEERKVTKEVETDEIETYEVPIYDCSEAE